MQTERVKTRRLVVVQKISPKGSAKDSPKSTDDLDSIGIIPHLRAPRGYTTYYGRADVDKENADHDAAIKRYLDNPKFNPNAIDKLGNTPPSCRG